MTVRLAQQIGMRPIVENAKQFGITDHMPPVLSMALGAGETNLLKMTMAYDAGQWGKYVEPVMIDRIQDRYGKTIFKTDNRYCEGCLAQWIESERAWNCKTIAARWLIPKPLIRWCPCWKGW